MAQGRDKLAYLPHLFYKVKDLVFERSCHLLELGHMHVYVRDECPFEWCLTLASLLFPVDFDDLYRQHSFGFHAFETILL